MAKKVATAKQTSGGGFDFEDKVVAWFLAELLNNDYPFNTILAKINRIEFQTRSDGWYLDDLLLRLKSFNNEDINVPFTIKSNLHFSSNGPNDSMNRDLWEQFLNHETDTFNSEIDYLGTINPILSSTVSTNINKLISAAKASDPEKLQKRIKKTNGSGFSEAQIKIFNGFKCPTDLATKYSVKEQDVWKLLSRVIFLEFDFENTTSKDENQLVNKCRNSLFSPDGVQEILLCTKLCEIRKLLAGSEGASIDYLKLLGKLRYLFKFKGIKNHEADWLKIADFNDSKLNSIRDSIGGTLKIDQEEELTLLETLFKDHKVIFLLGESGFGKSVLSKKFALTYQSKFIWIDSGIIDNGDITNYFGLDNPIVEIIGSSQDASPMLVIDGIDRFFDSDQIGILRDLLAISSKEDSNWKVLISCQTYEYDNTLLNLYKANLVIKHHIHTVEPIGIKNLDKIKESFPGLNQLFKHDHLSRILTNLKYLDLLAYHVPAIESTNQFGAMGESTIIDWIWEEEIQRSKTGNGDQRTSFLQILASDQAETLKSGISKSNYDISQLNPLPSLKDDRLIYELEDKLFFSHDLFGDWARYKLIRSKRDELKSFLLAKNLVSPLWGKAIRLYAVSLLEKNDNGDSWKQIVSSLDQNDPNEKIIQDLFFEAILFSAATGTILESLWLFFKSDNGVYLNQFLSRFLIIGTKPNPRVLEIASEMGGYSIAEASTIHRVPRYLYWPPVLTFLNNHVDDIVRISRRNLAMICEKWLAFAPAPIPFREEVARCAFKNAEAMFNFKLNPDSWVKDDVDEIIYSAMLAGLNEYPDEIKTLSLKLVRRVKFDRPKIEKEEIEIPIPKSHLPKSRLWSPEVLREEKQWEHGPFERVDDAFEIVCLNSEALHSMILAYPETAKEILLALLIEHPRQTTNLDSHHYKLDINQNSKWHPPMYFHGPILYFLTHRVEIGIQLVLDLVNFATEQWKETCRKQKEIPKVNIDLGENTKEYFGDERVYFWYRDIGNMSNPLPTALMALEKALMTLIDNGHSISNLLEELLHKSNSVAILGVLSSLGRYKTVLFRNELRPLLGCIKLYDWEKGLDYGAYKIEGHQMIGAYDLGKEKWEEAKAWNDLAHRKISIGKTAIVLYLKNSDLDDFYVDAVQRWQDQMLIEEQDGHIDVYRTQIISQFNKANYELIKIDDNNYFQYVEPKEITEKLNPYRTEIDKSKDTFFLPFQYSKDIEENRIYTISEIEQLYNKAINNIDQDIEFGSYDCLFGAFAVIVNNRSVWKEIHTEYDEKIMKSIEEVLHISHAQIYNLYIVETTNSWRSFSAFILSKYWIENQTDKRISKLLAFLLLKSSNDIIEKVFQQISKELNWADQRFIQLQNLILEWSGEVYRYLNDSRKRQLIDVTKAGFWTRILMRLRVFKNIKQNESQIIDLDIFADSIIQKFISGKTHEHLLSWSEFRIEIQKTKQHNWTSSKRSMGRESGIKTDMIQHMYSSIPNLKDCKDEEEYNYILQFWTQVRDQLIFEIGDINVERQIFDELPQDFQIWGIKGIAKLISEVQSETNLPIMYWKPIFDYGYYAPHFVANLTSWFFIECIDDNSKYDRFHEEWGKMYDHAVSSENWNLKGEYRSYDVWEKLMGIHYSQMSYWDKDFQSFLDPIADRIFNYFESNVSRQDQITSLIILLRKKSGRGLIILGVPIIYRHLEIQITSNKAKAQQGRVIEDFRHSDSLAKTTGYLWENHLNVIKSNDETFVSFKKIILYLVSIQNAIGIELQSRISP